jgi:hypothetical protein
LLATTIFLIKRHVAPYQFSVASGRGINNFDTTEKIKSAFASLGQISPGFSGFGADILAASEQEWWAVECKGAGAGQTSTQRNNFDRALASVVSYYEEKPPASLLNAKVFLGLALPETKAYLKELQRRVRKPLRKRLNLWILLYEIKSREIRAVSPEDDI